MLKFQEGDQVRIIVDSHVMEDEPHGYSVPSQSRRGAEATILSLDTTDDDFPYQIRFDRTDVESLAYQWVRESWIEPVNSSPATTLQPVPSATSLTSTGASQAERLLEAVKNRLVALVANDAADNPTVLELAQLLRSAGVKVTIQRKPTVTFE